nr:glycosyltransferase family 2 protein [uncultured Bacteroides sp.]
MNKPLFSIVMVNYNADTFLEEAILSVLNQTCSDYELIMVDGGSKDNSVDIIKKYANRLSWWVSEPDKGQSDAFNKGFAHAKGDYFVWLNSDDLMLPRTLEIVKFTIINNLTCKWFALNTVYIDKDDCIWRAYKTPSYPNRVMRNGYIEMGAPSSFFHRSIYEKCGPFVVDYHYMMDIDLWLKFIYADFPLKRINNFGWAFRDHEGSKTSSSLKGKPSEKFLKEKAVVLTANNCKPKKLILLLQKLSRIIYSYPRAWYYTKKYTGKNISELKQ